MKETGAKKTLEEARSKYFQREFRAFMRKAHGFDDEDFAAAALVLKEMVLSAPEKSPRVMLDRILSDFAPHWTKPSFPSNADWHHFLVPGVIVCALRNCGYVIRDEDIAEAMSRGEKLLGGSCGFAGACGGAYGVGIVLSIARKLTPIHDIERSETMLAVSETLRAIAAYPRRCCKRSSYTAIQVAVHELRRLGYERLDAGAGECRWHSQNKMCYGARCPFYPPGRDAGAGYGETV